MQKLKGRSWDEDKATTYGKHLAVCKNNTLRLDNDFMEYVRIVPSRPPFVESRTVRRFTESCTMRCASVEHI